MGQSSQINFGCPWFLSHGHLAVLAAAFVLLVVGAAIRLRLLLNTEHIFAPTIGISRGFLD